MNISIAIADVNRDYLERLAEVLQEYEDLTISRFTSAERLEQALQQKKYDVVLFNPDISDRRLPFGSAKLWICLYSDEVMNSGLYTDLPKVMKYQRVSRIYKEIIKAYAEKTSDWSAFESEQNTKLLAVYSPIGGSGKTVTSLIVASKLMEYGKNVLFISTEQLNSFADPNAEAEETITALVEALNENINFELKLKSITKEVLNDIPCIEGFDRIVDYNTISKEEMSSVLDKIRKYCQYDAVVIDMASGIDEIGQAVFENADNIIIVDRVGEIAESKMNMFARQALACENMKKMYTIFNFADKSTKDSTVLEVPSLGRIYNYGNQPVRNIVQTVCANDDINLGTLFK